jgi:hypothetical protein
VAEDRTDPSAEVLATELIRPQTPLAAQRLIDQSPGGGPGSGPTADALRRYPQTRGIAVRMEKWLSAPSLQRMEKLARTR